MNVFATILLTICTCTVFAQHKTHNKLSQSIHDDGKTMIIEMSGDIKGKPFTYNRTVDVTGMSSSAKDALVNGIADSLGIEMKTRPVPPKPPAPPLYTGSDDNSTHSSIHDNGNVMHVKITGTRNNQPVNYEHTFTVKGLSAKQKNTIIRHITDSLRISNNVIRGTN